MTRKKNRISIRLSDTIFYKLLAISKATDKTKTAVIEDLILSEYGKNKVYEQWYNSIFRNKS